MALDRSLSDPGLCWLLKDLAEIEAVDDAPVAAVTLDSRKVTPGTLFLACAGGRSHGLDYARQAVAAGAVTVACEAGGEWSEERIASLSGAVNCPVIPVPGLSARASDIAGRFFADPSRTLRVIGITGTNGKTSCSQFLAQAASAHHRCGIVGTLGSGFPGRLRPSTHTTPDAVQLQADLARLLGEGAEWVALEVSSHALDQGRVAGVHFDTGVFTNLSRDHLDYHGDMAGYGAAKRQLFRGPDLRCAVINVDDPFGRELLAQLPPSVTAIAYAAGDSRAALPTTDMWLQARRIRVEARGMTVEVDSSWGGGTFETRLFGRFNVSNLLAVAAVLLESGIDLASVLERMSQLTTVPGRMEYLGDERSPGVVVDYAHTPDALDKALAALHEHAPGRLICVFGCGGERDEGKRPLMGAVAQRWCDQVILTDDNPRREDGDAIIDAILGGVDRPELFQVERDRAAAIRSGIDCAGKGDLVLVAGKGHETVQQIAGSELPFSDREQVLTVLGERRRGSV